MMYKKGLTLLIAVMITVMLSPFKIYADTIPANEPATYTKEVTIKEQGGSQTVSISGASTQISTYYASFNINGVLYKSYLGYIQVTVTYSFLTRNGNSNWTYENREKTVSHYCSVYGNSFVWSDDFSYIDNTFSGINSNNSSTITVKSLSITASNVVEIEDESQILQDIKDSINDAVDKLNNIESLRKWDIPIESLSYNMFQFQQNLVINDIGINDLNYNNYPIFDVPSNTTLYSMWGTQNGYRSEYTFIQLFRNNIQDLNNLKNKVSVSDGEIISYNNLQQFYDGGEWWSLTVFRVGNFNSTGIKSVSWVGTPTSCIFIFANYSTYNYLSNDFALRYGLSNNLLNSLDKIANGTSASTSAAQSNDSANSQLQTTSNQLFTQEDNFKSDMNNAMSNIPSFSVNNFGSKFMTSATWVRQQYERMTNNTPFQQVITFSLLVGLSMILIGKVRK